MQDLFLQAFAFHQQGRLTEAEALYRAVLAEAPGDFNALHLLGVLLHQRGLHAEGLVLIEKAIDIHPGHAAVHLNHGATLVALKQHERAVASYDRALSLNPHYCEALADRGTALRELGRYEEALASYDQALQLQPDNAEVLSSRGAALQSMKQFDAALQSYERALTLLPNFPQALSNRGVLLAELHRFDEALASYDQALRLKPDYAEAFYNRGNLLREMKRFEDAVESYRRALTLKPDYGECLYNCAALFREMDRHEQAATLYARLLAVGATYPYALGSLLDSRLHCCDWAGYADAREQIIHAVKADQLADVPFPFLAICDDAELQLRCARLYTSHKYPTAAQPLWSGQRRRHDRIRLAYLSADFHNHATAYLMAGLFELHDRQRFEVTAVSFGPNVSSPIRWRLEKSFDRFVDVQAMNDLDVARLMLALEIDIAVDLKGFTRDARPGILALRPAPLQVSYLGYPGTMGADYLDYIVADRHTLPEAHTAHYAEKVVWLPDSYQVNDARRPIAERTPTRLELGLPDKGFVFCSFNSPYKITPPIFDVWMRLLQAVHGSVLWLLGGNAVAEKNLRREASVRGVSPDRLVFAPRMELADHLARHRQADLFLDNLPYNAHTTASDALWAGLPVLTCMGESFASRVAGSLLHAIGLPELIARNLKEYESLALELATHRAKLTTIRDKLDENRLSHPLFDTDRFRKNIESAYIEIWKRHQQGLAPDHVDIKERLELS